MNIPHSSGGFYKLSNKQVSHSPKRQTKEHKSNYQPTLTSLFSAI